MKNYTKILALLALLFVASWTQGTSNPQATTYRSNFFNPKNNPFNIPSVDERTAGDKLEVC